MKKLAKSNDPKKNSFYLKGFFTTAKTYSKILRFLIERFKKILEDFEIKSSYKKDFATKRLKILRALILGKDEHIKGLSWKK